MAGKDPSGMGRIWRRTRRAWVLAALGALTFLGLNVLVLGGSQLALDLLISLTGALAGAGAARLATRPFRGLGASIGRTIGLFAGLASVFVIIFGGTALAGIPPYPTAGGGNVGDLIYGLAVGFGAGVPGGLVPPDERAPAPDPSSGLRVLAVVAGTVAALFAALFVLWVVLEYVVVPLIRVLAA